MKHRNLQVFKQTLAHLLLGLTATALSSGANAQSAQAHRPSTGSTATDRTVGGVATVSRNPESENEAPQKAGHEGIKVHGHWVMMLRNPDGKIVDRREFDNSLVGVGQNTSGDQLLAALLSGNAVTGAPAIALATGTIPVSDQSQMCALNGYGVGCYFITTTLASPLFANSSGGGTTDQFVAALLPIATGLTETVTFSPTVSWVLSGNFTVPSNFNSNGFSVIAAVQTIVPICSPATGLSNLVGSTLYDSIHGAYGGQTGDYSPKTCAGNVITNSSLNENVFAASFTSTNIPSAITVTPGQVITVTVTITFS